MLNKSYNFFFFACYILPKQDLKQSVIERHKTRMETEMGHRKEGKQHNRQTPRPT